MCHACWQEYGAPRIINDGVKEAAKSVEEVYAFSLNGGSLHVAIDDWNLETDSILFCKKVIEELDNDITEKQKRAERKCVAILLTLTLEERASALALQENFFSLKEEKTQ